MLQPQSRPNKQKTFSEKSTMPNSLRQEWRFLIHFKLMFSLFTVACVPLHTHSRFTHTYTIPCILYAWKCIVFPPPICVMACLRLTNSALRQCLSSLGWRARTFPRRLNGANRRSSQPASHRVRPIRSRCQRRAGHVARFGRGGGGGGPKQIVYWKSIKSDSTLCIQCPLHNASGFFLLVGGGGGGNALPIHGKI